MGRGSRLSPVLYVNNGWFINPAEKRILMQTGLREHNIFQDTFPFLLNTIILAMIAAPPMNVPAFGTSFKSRKPITADRSGVTKLKFVTSLMRSA